VIRDDSASFETSANGSATTIAPSSAGTPDLRDEVTLLELLDRVLDKGVVLTGDVTLSVADVDLVYVGLRVLLSSVEAMQRTHGDGAGNGDLGGRSP
jgi:hypothetical protein